MPDLLSGDEIDVFFDFQRMTDIQHCSDRLPDWHDREYEEFSEFFRERVREIERRERDGIEVEVSPS